MSSACQAMGYMIDEIPFAKIDRWIDPWTGGNSDSILQRARTINFVHTEVLERFSSQV